MVKALPLALLALAACLGAAHAECEAEEKALVGTIIPMMMADPTGVGAKMKACGRRRRLEGSSRRRLADCSDGLQDAFDDAYDCKEDPKFDCAAEAFG
eukprot:SAG25_NODE_384_length_8785_cov_7.011628_3_plen_98_part_00